MSEKGHTLVRKESKEPTLARRKKRKNPLRWYLMIPCLGFILYFAVVPTGFLWWVSFMRYDLIMPDLPVKFVGFKNFINVLTSLEFWEALKITLWMSVVGSFIQLAVGLGIALLLDQIVRGRKIITTMLLIPMMVAPAAVGFMFKTMYQTRYGPFNYFLSMVGLPTSNWTGSVTMALPSIMLAHVWQWSPFMMILLLAGLASLPRQVFEVSSLMTKSAWKTFIHVTLPLLKPFIFLALVLRMIDGFKYLAIIWITTEGGPGSATENLAFLTFRKGLVHFNIGVAGALSVIQLVIIVVICSLLLKRMTIRPPKAKIA